MANAIYKRNYDGLKKRDTYDEIVYYLENKQEKINSQNDVLSSWGNHHN